MPWSLNPEPPKVRYSRRDRLLFSLIPPDGTMVNSAQLLEEFLKASGSWAPFHARSIVVGTLRTLSRKIEANREPFVLCKTEARGPVPIQYWLARRAPEKKRA